MLKLNKALLLSALLVTNVCMANSEAWSQSAYVSLGGGFAKVKNVKNSDLPITTNLSVSMTEPNELGLNFKNTTLWRAALGTSYDDVRYEVEANSLKSKYKRVTAGYGQYDFDDFNGKSVLPGFMAVASGLVNIYYDFPISQIIKPYVGTGVGYAVIKNEMTLESTPKLHTKIKERKPVIQGVLGLSVNLTDRTSLGLDYRIFKSKKIKALNSKVQHQSLNLNISYKF